MSVSSSQTTSGGLEVGSTIFKTMLARLKTQQRILCPMSNLDPFMYNYDGELAVQHVWKQRK